MGIQYQIQLMLEFLEHPPGNARGGPVCTDGRHQPDLPLDRWVFLSFMLFASTLSVGIKSGFIFPIEQLQSQGRPVTIAFMILLMATLLIMPAGWRRKYFVIGALFFLIFQVAMAMITTVRVSPLRGASSFVLFVLIFRSLLPADPRARSRATTARWDDQGDGRIGHCLCPGQRRPDAGESQSGCR
jgi:hypothetical protein